MIVQKVKRQLIPTPAFSAPSKQQKQHVAVPKAPVKEQTNGSIMVHKSQMGKLSVAERKRRQSRSQRFEDGEEEEEEMTTEVR